MPIQNLVLQITREALLLVLLLSGIPIILSMFVGVMVSVFQAATQIQEQTLTFVPKLIIVFGSILLLGYWMLGQMIRFTSALFELLPQITAGAG
jgi:flagellar biosynthetic protein FliQ